MAFITGSLLSVILLLASVPALGESFSADAVQIRDGQLSHAKMTWHGDKVRFDYVQDGVAMAQIFDNTNHKMVWLDTENKQYLQRDLEAWQLPDASVRPDSTHKKPCDVFPQAECVKLKRVEMGDREADKWLITFTTGLFDQHLFQWIDTELGVVLRQENPDGSMFQLTIHEDIEFDGRKVRKQEMYSVGPDGLSIQGAQWIDEKLNIVVRQQNDAGAVDELRNIQVGEINVKLFSVPEGYTEMEDPISQISMHGARISPETAATAGEYDWPSDNTEGN